MLWLYLNIYSIDPIKNNSAKPTLLLSVNRASKVFIKKIIMGSFCRGLVVKKWQISN